MRYKNSGFTLIELMIVIAIIGILAAIAVPQYSTYTKRAKFAELRTVVSPLKLQVAECYQRNNGAAACNTSAATATVPDQMLNRHLAGAADNAPRIASVTLTASGDNPRLTITPAASAGFLATETYVLTGKTIEIGGSSGRVLTGWVESGGGCDKGYC